MGISGNISTMFLTEVFQWLNNGLKTGTLQIRGKEKRIIKEVYFQNGVISSASSNDPAELIGQFLLATNQVTEQQLANALESQKRDHVLLGKILVQQRILNKKKLDEILRKISEEIIYDLFLWKEGQFEFKDDQLPKREIPSLGLDITHLVLEAAQREDEWKRIYVVFPNEHVVIRPNTEEIVNHLPLESEVCKVLTMINGYRNLYEIIRLGKATKFHLLKLLVDLHEEGLIEVGDFRSTVINPQVQVKKNPVREMIFSVEALMRRGKLTEAERAILKLEQVAGAHPDVKKLKEMIKEKRLETTAKEMINPNSIPILKMDVNTLTKMDFSAEQGFLVSRINGVWDVQSILKVAPFSETDCLKILKKFLDDGVIALK